jgi:nucleotide-binding universal stress UspA family protein
MFDTILVATDGSHHAEKALDIACDLAEKYGSSLTILSVFRHHSTPGRTHSMVGGISELEPPDVTLGKLAREVMDTAITRARQKGIQQVEGLVRRGPPARTIVQVAKERRADAIAMGSRGLGDAEGLLLGSVSHKVSSLAECTCITVK